MTNNIELVLDRFKIDYKEQGNRISIACPIHGGSKKDGCSIYTDEGYNWACWSHHCEKEYGQSSVCFVRALLEVTHNKPYTIYSTIQYLSKLFNLDLVNLTVDPDTIDKLNFSKKINLLNKTTKQSEGIDRNLVRKGLVRPVKYYLERGYDSTTLDKYDVGLCLTKGKQMYGRIVVPVYDEAGKYMVGCVGRTQHPLCSKCEYYHGDTFPCPQSRIEEIWYSKWINSFNFSKSSHFYNLWNAKDHINRSGKAIIVEGQGDVWRLEEAGISNSLGMFGTSLSDDQILILERLPINEIIVATDNDEPGLKAREYIQSKCKRLFNISFVSTEAKDIGDTPIDKVREIFNV